jgi:hypothetical protein
MTLTTVHGSLKRKRGPRSLRSIDDPVRLRELDDLCRSAEASPLFRGLSGENETVSDGKGDTTEWFVLLSGLYRRLQGL